MLDVLKPYAKSVAPLVAGIVVFLVGVATGDDTVKALGIGAIAASPLVYKIPND